LVKAIEERRMELAQKKVRSWCEECEAWHPRGMHTRAAEATEPAAPQGGFELRAEPRPVSSSASASRGSAWLRLAVFVFVILPIGVVAWSAAAYAVLLLWPHIKTALP
jgi:hypothetical protein